MSEMSGSFKNFLKRYFNSILGYYNVEDIIAPDKIRNQAIPFTPKNRRFWWFSRPVKPGIFTFEKNSKSYYICRTAIGNLFPSLFRLSLSPTPQLVPHFIRLVLGYFLCFLFY